MNTIESHNLVFRRGTKTILKSLSFTLEEGQLLGLVGHNGAGKSTLIKLLLGLLAPAEGTLRVLGAAPGTKPLEVGYLPENVSFYDGMTVKEHLCYFGGLKGVGSARVAELVEELGLSPVYGQRLGQCSKGQRQRLGLAQALLSKPRLLMLDEPTVGLDPAASALMYRELSALRDAGCTIVVCTHELALVEPYLDQALLLAEGEMRGYGTLAALRERAALPALISQISNPAAFSDPDLRPYVRGTRLAVPEAQAAQAVRILTTRYGCFDFQLRKADLGMIFDRYVLNALPEPRLGDE